MEPFHASTATWINARIDPPRLSDLPIFASYNRSIDLFSFTLPSEMDFWMPAKLPEPPVATMSGDEKASRLGALIDQLAGSVEAVKQLSETGNPTGADAEYLILGIERAYARKQEICGGAV